MHATRSARRGTVSLLAVGLFVVPAVPAAAESVEGRVAAARVREESYRHYLDDMLYTHAGDNRGITGPEHDPARDNIEALMTSFGLTVTLEPFLFYYPVSGTVYYNVVGTKLGTTYPDQEYIVGAHYDSDFNPGADDNASGVALVLEAARVLSTYDSEYTIRFIAFDVEEWGKVGAYAYVDDHIEDDILGMISADMVAHDAGRNIADIWCTAASAPLKSTLAQAVGAYGDGLWYELGSGFSGSDHWPFEQAGFEACLLIEDAYSANPFYHTLQDNVDEPNYIDYAYAIRITRSAVGFLVDNAGVHVDIPDADYDGDGDVDEDDFSAFSLCYTGQDTPPADPDCYFFDLDSDGDIDCADWDLFAAVWTGPPVAPPTFAACEIACFPSNSPVLEALTKFGDPLNRKNRYISVSLTDAGRTQAIRVVLGAKDGGRGNIPPPFEIWKGQEFFAGEPRPYCENAGQGSNVRPDVAPGCGQAPGVYENEQIWFWGAPLVCEKWTAHFMDWTTLANHCNTPANATYDAIRCTTDDDCGPGTCGVSDVVHLFHEGIVPSHMASGAGPIGMSPTELDNGEAVYEVSAIDDTCALDVEENYSPPAQLHQAGWGDVVLSVADCPNWPPEESVGVVTDVVALLNKFSNNNCAVQKTRADLVPCRVDFNISISDVVAALGAFTGGDYEDTCGSGQCGPLGLCKGGADHGQPCTNDDDCNSDVCFGKFEVAGK